MPNWGHAADGKTRAGADKGRIRTSQSFARNLRGKGRIHLIAARRDEQDRRIAVLTTKDNRFGDLVDLTPGFPRRVRRRARLARHL